MNGCRMDDPHNDNSVANIFGEIIRRQGASYGREVPARASSTCRGFSGRGGCTNQPAARRVSQRLSWTDSAEGSGGESPPPLAPTDPPTGAGFLQPQGDGTRFLRPQGDGTRFFGGMLRALLIFPLVALLSAAIATFAISWQQRQPETRAVAAVPSAQRPPSTLRPATCGASASSPDIAASITTPAPFARTG